METGEIGGRLLLFSFIDFAPGVITRGNYNFYEIEDIFVSMYGPIVKGHSTPDSGDQGPHKLYLVTSYNCFAKT